MNRSLDESLLRDSQAENYDNWYLDRGANAVLIEDEAIIDALKLDRNRNLRLLDAGCGTGRLISQISNSYPNLDIDALDISNESIKLLKSKDLNIRTNVFDFSSDSLRNIGCFSYDRILSVQMLQHLTKDGSVHALNEMYKVLIENGYLVIELYNYSGLVRKFEQIKSLGKIKKMQYDGLFYEYRYTALELKSFIIRNSPFSDVEIFGVQNIPRILINKYNSLIKLDKLLSTHFMSIFFGYYFIAICKK